MRLLIVGAGAVGGYFGALLARAGRDVTFLVRPTRADVLRRDGLRVVGGQTFTVPVHLEVTGAITATYDAILLAVKAYSLDDAMRDIAPAVGSNTMILPLLNGMRHLDRLAERFGDAAVLGGVSAVVASLDEDGAIAIAPNSQAIIRYGERAGGISRRVGMLDEALRGARFDAVASEAIVTDMWRKWIVLASLGALNALMRGNVGEIEAAGGAGVATSILDEAVAVARASGFPSEPDAVAGYRAFLTEPGGTMTSSMYRDLLAGNAVEGEHIVGDLVDRGRALGVATPLLEAARVNLRVYENRR
jgi:2-dehydropantoate 2-reductase